MLRDRPRHALAGLRDTIALATPILAGLGFSGEQLATIETDDPFVLGAALRAIEPANMASPPADFLPLGGKRDVLRLALSELQPLPPTPPDLIPLPPLAPLP